jgi:pimeloyl-ACP methyl ester carboxylesterase
VVAGASTVDGELENPGTRRRPWRWLRLLGLLLLGFLTALTLAAIAFDLATAGNSRPAQRLYPGPFVQVGDTLVAYRRWGTTGSPILLIGGAAEPSWVWHTVGPLLAAKGHRVFAIDLPPFGYTERHGPYTMGAWVALVRGFVRSLGICRPLIVGHSLGAGVAAADALADPGEVAGVVFLDGDGVPFGHGIGWFSRVLVFPYYTALYRIVTGSDWVVSRVLANAWGPGHPHFGHRLVSVFERPFRVSGTAGAIKQLARRGIPGVPLTALRRLRVPRAVVWGAHDNVDSLESGRITARVLHVPVVIIPNAGHLSMLGNPRATAAAIQRESAQASTRCSRAVYLGRIPCAS